MRVFGVLLSVLVAGVVGGVLGYSMANRARFAEITLLTQERDNAFIRERELQAQVEEALAARAALAQETQRLQQDLSERLRRLEEAAARLTPAEKPQLQNEEKGQQ
jgi:hypothetical protein